MAGDLLQSSLSSASSLMGLQLLSRLFTFALNQALFRMVSPEAFGTAAIQFELLLGTILFMSRQGVRNALLRVNGASSGVQNMSFVPILVGIPLSILSTIGYIHFASNETGNQPHFRPSVLLYALASIVELLNEPFHNFATRTLQTTVRVKAEGMGITFKTATTFLVLLYDARTSARQGDLALPAFALGQLVYAATVLLMYYSHYGIQQWKSARTKGSAWFDAEALWLSLTMTSQSLIQHLLTEGDKIVLSSFSNLQDQGGYAIAVNYGSLIARIVFQPIEETSRLFFSRVLADVTAAKTKGENSLSTKHRPAFTEAADALVSLVSVQVSLSIIFLNFASAYLPIALHILLPGQYLATSAPIVLQAYIWYIPVLAINGGMEAFLSGSSTPKDLFRQSRWMAGCWVIYITTAVLLFRLDIGDASLVYANIFNLGMRITYATWFASAFFPTSILRWRNVLPNRKLLLVCGLSAVVVRLTRVKVDKREQILSLPVAIHVLAGGIMFLCCVGTWWITSGRKLRIRRTTKTE